LQASFLRPFGSKRPLVERGRAGRGRSPLTGEVLALQASFLRPFGSKRPLVERGRAGRGLKAGTDWEGWDDGGYLEMTVLLTGAGHGFADAALLYESLFQHFQIMLNKIGGLVNEGEGGVGKLFVVQLLPGADVFLG